MPLIKGTAVAPGLALGAIHVVGARQDVVPVWTIPAGLVDAEIARTRAAIEEAATRLEEQRQAILQAAGEQDAGILAVHCMVLEDPSALKRIERTIRDERVNAETAIQGLIDVLHEKMKGLEGANVRQYAADLSEPWRGVLDVLLWRDQEQLDMAKGQVVLAAAELTPQVVTCLARERILAVVTETGGRFSHGAVLARSFGVPCVVGLTNLLARLEQDVTVIVDGDNGTLNLRPSEEDIDHFLECRRQRDSRGRALASSAGLPAITTDGRQLTVAVNMESIRDLDTFHVEHCDGLGLLRTEFLYMERSQFPSEEEQYRMYRRVLDTLGDKAVTIRTLDIGGDKVLPYFKTPHEDNPALGWRGLRLTLEWQDLLRVQLRALLRASAHGRVRMLLPMVTSVEEIETVHEIFLGVRKQLISQGYETASDVPVGAMIEVPSTLWIMDELVEMVDFISVGSNDLTQYLLAVDRDNTLVAKLYEPHHPAVLRALAHVAEVCTRHATPCSICGEIAGDYAMALVLFGMGYDMISVSPNFLAELRFAVRHTAWNDCHSLAEDVLEARTPAEVRELLAQVRAHLHRDLLDDEAEVSPLT